MWATREICHNRNLVYHFCGTGASIIKADTLEDLAKGLNIPVDTFVESVKHYNELCYAGEDTDYYKEKHRLTPVDTAPF